MKMDHVFSDLLEAFNFTETGGTIQNVSSGLRLELLNGFLFLIGLYTLIVFIPFLIHTWRIRRNAVVDATFLNLIGHTMFRGWTWLSWHSVNEHWDVKWMSYIPVWEISTVILAFSILWLSNILIRVTILKDRNWIGWVFGWDSVLPLFAAIIGALLLRLI